MSLIIRTTKDIMLNGINIFAKSLNEDANDVQILFALNEKEELKYYKCQKWKPIEEVTFLKILGKSFDIFNYQKLASPFLKNSILKYSNLNNIHMSNVFIYISKDINNQLWIGACTKEKELETITIEEHFISMGIK